MAKPPPPGQLPLFGDPEPATPAATKPVKEPWESPPAPMAVLRAKARACGSCQAAIVFAMVDRPRANTGARTMPVNVDPDPDGNVHLWIEGRTVRGKVLTKAQRDGRASLHKSHFASCSAAEQHRTRGRS